MSILGAIIVTLGCVLAGTPSEQCTLIEPSAQPTVAGVVVRAPQRTGTALDVELSAASVLVWDMESGAVLYRKAEREQRPIASVTKLLSALVVRERLELDVPVEIGAAAKTAARRGANIKLPEGEHATVRELLSAGLIASANDAMAALGAAVAESEEAFAVEATKYAAAHGMLDTKAANATGLSGGEQYSTAADVRIMMERAYADPVLRPLLRTPEGTLTTSEGSRRAYKSTNKLLNTYLPILAAKTGYTTDAGENLAIITQGPEGQQIGAVVLGSSDRFQDMKVLVEWVWRNYTWED